MADLWAAPAEGLRACSQGKLRPRHSVLQSVRLRLITLCRLAIGLCKFGYPQVWYLGEQETSISSKGIPFSRVCRMNSVTSAFFIVNPLLW
jgi:hypothetical protein